MNRTLGTILLVLTIVILAAAIFFAGTMYARSTMMVGWNNNSLPGSGMMAQGGMTLGPGASAGVNGMMGRMMTGNGGMMNGMMNRYGSNNPSSAPLTVEQAKAAAEKYLSNLENSGLTIGEIMIFDNHAYVVVKEQSTGLGAFELLIDPASQTAYPEHGPDMMWNLKYGGLSHQFMMGSNGVMMNMMGVWNNAAPIDVSADMPITPEQAVEYAQKYLDANIAGAVARTPIQFYGYYTLDFEKDGKVAGMLSVNGYSGQVFLHTWHGAFVEEAEE